MCSPSTRSHFKKKVLKSLNTKLPEVTRTKKQFQNQPSDAISKARLLSKGKPRIMVHLQKTEIIFVNMVHTLVLVSGPSGKEGKVLSWISTQAKLHVQHLTACAHGLGSFIGAQPQSFICTLSMAAFTCHGHSWGVAEETVLSPKPKIFTGKFWWRLLQDANPVNYTSHTTIAATPGWHSPAPVAE